MIQRILVLGDDTALLEIVRHALAGLGAEVHSAPCAAIASSLRRMKFELVILLSPLPLLSGSSPMARIRPQGLRRPLLYVVSWQQTENLVLSLLECGVDQYMTFPLSLQRLRAKVAHELNMS